MKDFDFPIDHRVYSFPELNREMSTDRIINVTSGVGCEVALIIGSDGTALIDCSVAYCHKALTDKIKAELAAHNKNSLDYIFVTHTHYDHIGALPYVLKEYPEAVVCGAEKAAYIFTRPGARAVIKNLGEQSRDMNSDSKEAVEVDGLRIDKVLADGAEISLGDITIKALETKGHTDCSMTYVAEPLGLMFTSESTGVLKNPNCMTTAMLKNCNDSLESAKKCKEYKPKQIFSPHFGFVPEHFTDDFFDLFVATANAEMEYIGGLYKSGLDFEQIMEHYTNKFWTAEKAEEQPKDAFIMNAQNIIRVILNEFD